MRRKNKKPAILSEDDLLRMFQEADDRVCAMLRRISNPDEETQPFAARTTIIRNKKVKTTHVWKDGIGLVEK